MSYPSAFESSTVKHFSDRLAKLQSGANAQWGEMDAGQMLAHLNASYDLTYGRINPNYGWVTKKMLQLFVKKKVVSDKPYSKNGRTAPEFLIKDKRDFDKEQKLFLDNMEATVNHGANYFEGKENPGFGKLSSKEWSNLFSKHIDHHFTQFGI